MSLPVSERTVLYVEDFTNGPGKWCVGRDQENGPYHRNIYGRHGGPTPVTWHEAGGRSGAFASSEPPWYFDDNHAEFRWLFLAFFMNRSADVELDGADLRRAEVRLTVRGRDMVLNGSELHFWIQGPGADGVTYNWALTDRTIRDELVDGAWHDLSLQLTNDEADWAPMGHTSFARKMNIELPLDRCAGTLDGILGGAHINFGFLLCGITPQNPPTGAIDVDQVKILTSFA